MKILCQTKTIYSDHQVQSDLTRFLKSTLAIGTHPPGKENAEYFILLFTTKNKTGIRYQIKDNIKKVFASLINEGKATIGFKAPAHQIQIQCDSLQLKNFFRVLKLAIEGNYKPNYLPICTMATTPIPDKAHPVTKMIIQKRADYPIKGFPRTLEILHINSVCRCSINSQILSLKFLRVLNFSKNEITEIPKMLGEMNLIEIDLSNNFLFESTSWQQWKWLEMLPLQRSLQSLNLSSNKLEWFPYQLVKFEKIVTLKISCNRIKQLPFGIRRMKSLRYLDISKNNIGALPSTVINRQFSSLNVAENDFDDQRECYQFTKKRLHFSNLLQLAARVVVSQKIFYSPSIIPTTVIDTIEESGFCKCGQLCFKPIVYVQFRTKEIKAKELIMSPNTTLFENSIYCTVACAQKFIKQINDFERLQDQEAVED